MAGSRQGGRRRPTVVGTVASVVLGLATVVVGAGTAQADTITSTGPLTEITISPDLNCDVRYAGDTDPEFFAATACGTLLASGGELFGPADIPAGGGATPRTGYTPTSQSSSGTGSAADPYVITTEVALGQSGLRIVQRDSYVVGQESYRTDTTVHNDTASAANAVLYKGGDCYLQNSDFGYGQYDAGTGAITCLAADENGNPGTRIEQFLPLSPGSNYLEDYYSSVWAAIGSQQPLPDQCAQCTSNVDNGIALSWTLAIPAGGAVTRSHLTTFSPTGLSPLTTTKTADSATVAAGAADGYTITVHNPNTTATTVTSITDTLPAGFTYTAGSTTGATTANPTVSGQTLTWNGSFALAAGGDLTLHFGVTVSSTPGTYYNNASATTDSIAVVPTGDTAPVTVQAVNVNHPPTASAGGPYSGAEGSPVAITGAAADQDGDPLTRTWSYTTGAGVDTGATCSFGNASALSTTVTCTDDGTYSLRLQVSDGQNPPVSSTTTLTVSNVAPSVSITSPADLSQVMTGASVSLTASVTDPGSNDTHTCTVDWGDTVTTTGAMSGGQCSASHTYAAIGVYTVTVTVTDDDQGVGTASIDLVVADTQTKVTGGGFVVDNGRTSFGFVAKTVGSGFAGQIQVRAPGHHRFHGSTVTALQATDTTATWSGAGRWDGADGYSFTVTVVDTGKQKGKNKTPDTIDVVIRDSAGSVVFRASGPLKGGNITVH